MVVPFSAGAQVPDPYPFGRLTGKTAAQASVIAYTVGAQDGSFWIGANVNVTASVSHSINAQVTYTDETNTAQTLTLTFTTLAGVSLNAITNVQGVGAYEGVIVQIRAKANTAITIKTTGTFTSVTYNVEGTITQVS